jgi:hypothetical protein
VVDGFPRQRGTQYFQVLTQIRRRGRIVVTEHIGDQELVTDPNAEGHPTIGRGRRGERLTGECERMLRVGHDDACGQLDPGRAYTRDRERGQRIPCGLAESRRQLREPNAREPGVGGSMDRRQHPLESGGIGGSG